MEQLQEGGVEMKVFGEDDKPAKPKGGKSSKKGEEKKGKGKSAKKEKESSVKEKEGEEKKGKSKRVKKTSKLPAIKEILADDDGAFVDEETGYILDENTEQVIGKKDKKGKTRQLTEEERAEAKERGFKCPELDEKEFKKAMRESQAPPGSKASITVYPKRKEVVQSDSEEEVEEKKEEEVEEKEEKEEVDEDEDIDAMLKDDDEENEITKTEKEIESMLEQAEVKTKEAKEGKKEIEDEEEEDEKTERMDNIKPLEEVSDDEDIDIDAEDNEAMKKEALAEKELEKAEQEEKELQPPKVDKAQKRDFLKIVEALYTSPSISPSNKKEIAVRSKLSTERIAELLAMREKLEVLYHEDVLNIRTKCKASSKPQAPPQTGKSILVKKGK